jgi:catechol 2,3-dioxygenase-like lactoylglutathione lyase family enzyme
MIAGSHIILFAEDAERARAFLRDVLGFEGVDAGGGWLIFGLPPGEMAVHPGGGGAAGQGTMPSSLCARTSIGRSRT